MPNTSREDSGLELLRLPDDSETADPFIIEHDGEPYVFCERIPPGGTKGEIAVGKLLTDGSLGGFRTIISEPHHMSYPQVIRWDGQYWMVPETSEVERIDLYRCEEFPYRWTFERTLLEGRAMVDATLLERSGKWYMSVTIDETGAGVEQALFVSSAETPLGPWLPHPMNPVCTDVHNVRGGGAYFVQDDALLRPAQDGSRGYGDALVFQHVRQLSEKEYKEERLTSYRPHGLSGVCGCHSYAAAGGQRLVDVRIRRWGRRRSAG